jgi:MFS family permease
MGIKKDLSLKGNDFSNTATWFFIAYLIAEVPNGEFSDVHRPRCYEHPCQLIELVYCLQKAPPAKWLGGNVFLWGIAAAASAGAQNYRSLLTARIFLGIFEATVGPSLMLISSQYYTRSEQAPRFTIWYMGLGVAQILGGLISFGFQHVHHASIEGWRIMFLVLGLITSVVGGLTFFFIPDTPMKATWLSEHEKVALLQHVSENQTGVWSTTLNLSQILEAVLDPQLWLLTLTTILVRRTFYPLLRLPQLN